MAKDRTIRSRRRGLNPTKVVFVYCLAFLLVCFHQSGRVADWFDDLAVKRDGFVSEASFGMAGFLRESVRPYGPAQLNWLEDKTLALFSPKARSRQSEGETRQAGIRGRLENLPPAEPAAPLGTSGAIARDLILKSHLNNEVRSDAPYPELPPIYLTKPPQSEGGGGQTASLISPTADLTSLTRKKDELVKPSRVLLLGDSMMLEGMGPHLQRALKQNKGLKVFRDGEYGTGLTRLDVFDWLDYFDRVLDQYEPDLVILTLGANDGQDMIGDGRRVHVVSDQWNQTYSERVAELLNRADQRGVTVFWVGLPIIGREPVGERIEKINSLVAETCGAAGNCRFWDGWLAVADAKGRYADYLRGDDGKSVKVRGKDKIHLTEAGGRIMADKFLADIAAWVDFSAADQKGDDPGAQTGTAPNGSADPGQRPVTETRPLAPSAGEGEDEAQGRGTFAPVSFQSAVRAKNTKYYLAGPALEPGRKYPLVVLLHGAWDGSEAWEQNIGPREIAALADRYGLVLLMPDGEPFGWYVDGRETAVESYLIKELIPHVLANHPEVEASKIGISGLSMGGHGALTLTLKYPDLFKATTALSAVTDPRRHAAGRHPVDKELRLDQAFGPAGPGGENWRLFSAHGLTEMKESFWVDRPLMLSVGKGDKLTLEENRAFNDLLVDQKSKHLYQERRGGHDWPYWRSELPAHLEFMNRQLSRPKGQ